MQILIMIKKDFHNFFSKCNRTFFFLIKFPLYRYGYSFLITVIILLFLIVLKDFINHEK